MERLHADDRDNAIRNEDEGKEKINHAKFSSSHPKPSKTFIADLLILSEAGRHSISN